MDGLGGGLYYTKFCWRPLSAFASIFVGQCPIDEPGCWPALCRRLFVLCRLHHLYPISESFGQCPNDSKMNLYNETTLWMRDDYHYSQILNYNCNNRAYSLLLSGQM
jgi:hypothetical protein